MRSRFPLSALSTDELEHLCLDFDLACLDQLEWIERRERETVEQDVVPRKRNTIQVPKYSTIEELLALDLDDEVGTGEGRQTLSRSEIQEQADALLKDAKARMAFLYGSDELCPSSPEVPT